MSEIVHNISTKVTCVGPDKYMYRVFIGGELSEFWSAKKACAKSEIARELQSTLRMMDKCGYNSNMLTRARYRFWEKLDKLQKWKDSLK